MRLSTLLVALALIASLSTTLLANVTPEGLKCEYRQNPAGLDVTRPRLSWILSNVDASARGTKQTGYRILAASSRELLAKNTGDLWDTQQVRSAQSIQVVYDGKPLQSRSAAFWKVQIWDQNGTASRWSDTAFWTEGLLKQEDWSAQWIGQKTSGIYRSPHTPLRHLEKAKWIWTSESGPQTFTAQFSISPKSGGASGTVVMTADKDFELSLNGRVVNHSENVGAPTVWDISSYLRPGLNDVQVKANPSKTMSGLIGAIHVETLGHQSIDLVTSKDWKAGEGAVKELGAYGIVPWNEIGYQEERALPARMLRREFDVAEPVLRATAYVSGLGLSELYINGAKIGDDVLAPNLTDYNKRVQYVVYDVTRDIANGKNAVGLMLGNGRFWAPRAKVPFPTGDYGAPRGLVQLEIEYRSGKTLRIATDTQWKLTSDGPVRANNEYDGEEFDATAELTGWSKAGFDDSKWRAAEAMEAPKGKLVAQTAEPLRVTETIKPVKITELRPGVYIYDMGQNMVGWCRLHVTGPKNTVVRLRHAETLKDNGELYTDNLRSARATDFYTLRGGAEETWEPRFTYHGFRFVEVHGFPGKPTLASIEGRVVHDSMTQIASFESSDKMLNQIHHNVFWGVRGNYRSIPTDCPQRDERHGWLGDRSVVSRSESYLFDVAAFYNKWERDLVDSQKDTGAIPDVSPNYWAMYNDDITWPSTFVQVPGMLYDQYADVRAIEENYPHLKKWMEHEGQYLQDGLLPKDTYGDWCVPPEDPKLIHSQDPARKTDGTLLSTAYFYWMNRQMAKFAQLVGKEDDATAFNRLADQIKVAFNKKYFNASTGVYANGTQTANILPLAFDMVAPENKKTVFNGLIEKIEKESKGHVGTGLVGAQWLMRTLSENGRTDVALQIATQPTYPGWGYMVSKGATTVWELWNGDTADPAMNSANHVMQIGDLGLWMYENLAGIRPDPQKPAFQHFTIRPYTGKELTFVTASHESPYGLIRSHWQKENGKLRLDIVVPANTTATVHVPAADASQVMEGNGAAQSSTGVKFARMEAGAAIFEVEPGTYSFAAPMNQ